MEESNFVPIQGTPVAVSFENVAVSRGSTSILDGVNAVVPWGSSTAVIGPNGAGKTSLIMALLGELAYTGHIRIGSASGNRPLRIGLVPQRLALDRGMPMSVLEFLCMGLQLRPLWLGLSPAATEKVLAHLDLVKASHLSRRRMGDLSGGELQRVLLAAALLRKPELLVLDEPSAGVDIRGEQMFCCLLEELRLSQGFTQIMVSHSLGMVARHASHVIALNKHVIAQGNPKHVLTGERMEKLFGIHIDVTAQMEKKIQ